MEPNSARGVGLDLAGAAVVLREAEPFAEEPQPKPQSEAIVTAAATVTGALTRLRTSRATPAIRPAVLAAQPA